MTFVRQTAAVAYKDLLVEWRAPARFTMVLFFAASLMLVASFALGAAPEALSATGGPTLWVGMLLASTRSLDQSFSAEMEGGALEGLVLLPVSPLALFYGKALANTLILLGVAAALLPIMMALFDVPMRGSPLMLAGFIVLGSAALAGAGTLYAAITAQARGPSALLPILMFPLLTPAVTCAARGTALVLEGDLQHAAATWLWLLAAFDAVTWVASGLLFGRIVEDA